MLIAIHQNFHGLTLEKRCGSGAFGDVFVVRDLSGKELALKLISKSRCAGVWQRELHGVCNYRLLTEAAEGLLRIFQVGEDEEYLYYSMELADNVAAKPGDYQADTLARRLADGPLKIPELIGIFDTILHGVAEIHRGGMSHHDLKPDNILFINGQAKIGDIGLMTGEQTILSRPDGTLGFVPPESHAAAAFGSSQARSNDLYALGKVLYCMTTGLPPGDFPSFPRTLPADRTYRQLMWLARQLCDREPLNRCVRIEQLIDDWAIVRRRIARCDSLGDRGRLMSRTGWNLIRRWGRFGWRRKWWIVVMLVLLSSTWIVWDRLALRIERPQYDVTRLKTKVFQADNAGLSMSIPYSWEMVSRDTVKELFKNNDEAYGFSREYLEHMKKVANNGIDMLVCSFNGEGFCDNITLESCLTPLSLWNSIGDDELRMTFKQLVQGTLKNPCEIYDLKRSKIGELAVIRLDFSTKPGELRQSLFILSGETRSVLMTLSARASRYHDYSPELMENLIRSMKFTKPL